MARVFKMSGPSVTEFFDWERRGGDTGRCLRAARIPVTHCMRILLCTLMCMSGLCVSAATETNAPAQTNAPTRAKLRVSGYGILGNRELKRILKTVQLGTKKPEFFDPVFV